MKKFLAVGLYYVVFILLINVKMPTDVGILTLISMLINVKMPTDVGILTFMSRTNFMLS